MPDMMKSVVRAVFSRTMLGALLAVSAFTVWAVPVSQERAGAAARAWSARGGRLGARLHGAAVDRVTALTATNGATLYAAKMSNGGTLFLSGDTEDPPVLAFSGGNEDLSSIDKNSPLWKILNATVSARKGLRTNANGAPSFSTTAASSSADSSFENEWAELFAEADRDPLLAMAEAPVAEVDDIRAGPLLKTKWAQSSIGEEEPEACWNFYTPNGSDPKSFVTNDPNNVVCGCVATATAQLLYYHRFPNEPIEPQEFSCFWGVNTVSLNLTMQGGVYDWASMPLDPMTDGASVSERAAVGKLTSDAGIALHMHYSGSKDGSSGAFSFDIPTALTKTFGYQRAILYAPSSWDSSTAYERAFYANFDAGLPVLVGLTGHQVVGDGYGYADGNCYVHLNMGWADESDIWYRLPDVLTMTLEDVCYNIVTNGTDSSAVLSGRVTDAEGNPVEGASVKLFAAGTMTLKYELKSDNHGVWGALVEEGKYDVSIEKGELCGLYENAVVQAPSVTITQLSGVDSQGSVVRVNSEVPRVSAVSSLGNSWGNDVELEEAEITVYSGSTRLGAAATLDRALLIASSVDNAKIIVAGPAVLRKSMTVSSNCRIESKSGTVNLARDDDAALTVAAGANLTLSGFAFTNGSSTVVNVLAGGALTIAGEVDFGLEAEVAAVATADAEGLVFAAPITCGFTLDCAAANAVGQSFAKVTCSIEAFGETGNLVANFADEDLSVRGELNPENMMLKWAALPCPFSQAAGYYTLTNGVTNCYARLDRVLDQFELSQRAGELPDSPKLVICKDATLSRALTIGADLVISAASGLSQSPTIDFVDNADFGFSVTGGTLVVNGIDFSGYNGPGLFTLSGGDVALNNCNFSQIIGTQRGSGALLIYDGYALVNNCRFENCRLEDGSMKYGGAIYLEDADSKAWLADTVIVNCRAPTNGGGVYVGDGAVLDLSGDRTQISGNVSGLSDNEIADDIFLKSTTSKLKVVANGLGDENSVGVRAGVGSLMKDGGVFATIAASLSEQERYDSAMAFFRDGNDNLHAVEVSGATEEYDNLVWSDEEEDPRTEDQSLAVVRVSGAGSDIDGMYRELDDAMARLDGLTDPVTLMLMADCELTKSATLTGDVKIGSDDSGDYSVIRTDTARITVGSGAELTLTNVAFNGGAAIDVTGILIYVDGGTLTMENLAEITEVVGSENRVESAVWVGNGGTFYMEAGAVISDCGNLLSREADGAGYGGAVTVDASTAYLRGGSIMNCSAYRYGGGVFVGNRSTVYLSGSVLIDGNVNLDSSDSDLTVAAGSSLWLTDPLADNTCIGYYTGYSADEQVFGELDEDFAASLKEAENLQPYYTAVTNSAARFRNNLTGAYGVAVTNSSDTTLLVWSKSIASDGSFTNSDGIVYQVVGDIPVQEIEVFPVPIAFTSVACDASLGVCTFSLTNLVKGCWYSLYSTNSLVGGFSIEEPVAPLMRFQAERDGAWTNQCPYTAGQIFLRMKAEPGVIIP